MAIELANADKENAEAQKDSGAFKHTIEAFDQQTRMILLVIEDSTGREK
jgi:hypothetical protein